MAAPSREQRLAATESVAERSSISNFFESTPQRIRSFALDQYTQLRHRMYAMVIFVHLTVRSLYFPDEVSLYVDTLIRLLFSVYYIPFLAIVLALSHAALERIVWVLVIPVTQEMERRPFSTSSAWTLLSGLGVIASRMLPFVTLGVAAATVGHKLMNCAAEAMVDAYTTQHDLDYPLLRARARFTTKKLSRIAVCAVVATALATGFGLWCHTNAFVQWSSTQPWVTTASWIVFAVQLIFFLTTVLREVPLNGASPVPQRRGWQTAGPRTDALLPHSAAAKTAEDRTAAAVPRQTPTFLRPVASAFSTPNDSLVPQRRREGDQVASPLALGDAASRNSLTIDTPFRPQLPRALEDGSDAESEQASPLARRGLRPGASASEIFVSYVEDDWWRHHIHTMRYTAFVMVVLFTVAFTVAQGPVFGVMSGVMILCYLNLPHLFAYTTLSFSFAVTRTLRSFAWQLRHLDAILPCLVIVTPYQLCLGSAILYYRHHVLLCVMLLAVNVLLVARAIDLVREFDVTAQGSVQWKYADSGVLLPPSLASILENGHEKDYRSPDVVSLDMTIDLRRMKMVYASGAEVRLRRQVIYPPGALRRYLFDQRFYSYTLPRLLSLQSPGYFSGSKFRTMRVVLRLLSMTLLLVYGMLVFGVILQAAFPQLRPLPVRVTTAADNSRITFDHIVLRMHLLSQHASRTAAARNTSNSALAGYLSGRPEAASCAFQWSNVTSPANEDFYPQLCKREYYNTSVWELAVLAVAPYLFNVEEFNSLLGFVNEHLGSDWVIQPRHGSSCEPGDSNHRPTGWTDFYEVYSKQRDTSVISIRGTDMFSFTDFLFNINVFFEVSLYQLLTTFIPGAAIIPKDLVVDLLRTASLPAEAEGELYETWAELTQSRNHSLRQCHQSNYGRDFFADVQNHIAYLGSRPGHPKHILLTGHSLGGAVASIVASQMRIKAVAFSAPGIVLARKKFNFALQSLHQNVMTVISSNDIVPAVGEHGGEVHHVECLAVTRELCHAMEFMIGTLWRSCGSVRAKFPSIKDVI